MSQSLRIQLTLNSDTDCRFHRRKRIPRRKPANYPRILLCRILELLLMAVPKTGVFRRKTRNRQTIQEFCFAEFLSFVPLQRKTQCLRQNLIAKVLWHLKSPNLPKAPSQSPEFSGAEFGNSVLSSKARTGILSQNSANAEFWSFCSWLFLKQEFPDAKARLSLKFSRFFKSEVSPALPKPKKDSSTRLTARSE